MGIESVQSSISTDGSQLMEFIISTPTHTLLRVLSRNR